MGSKMSSTWQRSTRIVSLTFIVVLLTACGQVNSLPPKIKPLASATVVSKPSISVQPAESLVDQPVSIKLSGFEPNKVVTVRASVSFQNPFFFESYASYRTDTYGSVDIDQQTPITGTYTIKDGMGLFWSMQLKPAAPATTTMAPSPTGDPHSAIFPVQYTYLFTAEADGQTLAQTKIVRSIGLPGMTRSVVHENGLYGVFYLPPGNGPFPAVIALGGSDGGLPGEGTAQMLATHGYAALGLAYFDRLRDQADDYLPISLRMIPLEYFGKAIQWLRSQSRVDPDRIGVIGASRGGEAALLVGSTFPEVKVVVSFSAYTIVLRGDSDAEFSSGQAASSWSYRGQPVPFLGDDWPEYNVIHPYLSAVSEGEDPIPLIPDLVTKMETTPEIASAAIQVEKINGPVLLITGLDDRLVPSALYGEFAVQRLKKHNFPFQYQHLINPGAGHGLWNFPYLPELNYKRNHMDIWLGGNAQADAKAAAKYWPLILDFLAKMR